jgi:hypothetical protein
MLPPAAAAAPSHEERCLHPNQRFSNFGHIGNHVIKMAGRDRKISPQLFFFPSWHES